MFDCVYSDVFFKPSFDSVIDASALNKHAYTFLGLVAKKVYSIDDFFYTKKVGDFLLKGFHLLIHLPTHMYEKSNYNYLLKND